MNEEDLQDILTEAINMSNEYSNLRLGQCFFNILYSKKPKYANLIKGTEYDPFYNDDVIPDCITYLQSI